MRARLGELAKVSAKIFLQMSYLQLGLVALLAPIFTAGAITQEKDSQTYDILLSMADTAVEQYRTALRAWSGQDLGLAAELADHRPMEAFTERFSRELLGIEGPDAVLAAVRTLVAGRSLDRIADHAAIIGARIRYLITGDPAHLTAEIR